MSMPRSRAEAETADARDPLGPRRAQFAMPAGLIYLDGHSLGPASLGAQARVEDALRRGWGQRLIASWNDAGDGAGWIDWPARVGARIARLLGVAPDTVIVADSVSVNLFKLAAAALSLARTRTLIVEADEFPTDQYVMEGLGALAGAAVARTPAGEGAAALARTGGVLVKSIVHYRSAAIADVAAHESVARAAGGMVVWDASHATGAIAPGLAAKGARLAAGCGYKYLNGGPGAPAFVHCAADLAPQLAQPLGGWMGHAAPFAFESGYRPADGVARFAAGTPAILSLAALDGALDVFDGVAPEALQSKAAALGDLCLARATALGFTPASPSSGRGAHVGIFSDNGHEIVRALADRGVLADFRAPDLIRFGLAPLTTRFVDVWDAMDILGDILATRAWDDARYRERAAVT